MAAARILNPRVFVLPLGQDPSVQAIDAVVRALAADPERGLGAAEAARRLGEDGPNALRASPSRPWWRRLLSHLHSPLIYLLLGAVAISLAAWVFEGRPGWPVDAIVITLIIGLNATLGYFQEARAERAVQALQRMTVVTSAALR